MELSRGDQEQKEEWAMIRSGLDDLEKRAKLLPKLKEKGFEEEALLLCCCYIESMGNLYYREKWNQNNFCRVIRNFGGEDILQQIHPEQLWSGLKSAQSENVQQIAQKIGGTLKKAENKLYTETEILGLVAGMLNEKETKKLSDNLWRGTLSAFVYIHLSNPAVHEFGGATSSLFKGTTFKNEPVPILDFSLIFKAMLNILKNMVEISTKTATYFGQDFDSLLRGFLAIHKEWERIGNSKQSNEKEVV